jgi:Flp pilus assembly protein TadB
MVRVLKLTRQQLQERATREIKARTDARLTALIKEAAAERRLQYRRDQEQEDNQQPREWEDNQQPRESWNTCLNVSCFCLLLVTANALFIQYLLTRKL